MVSDYARQNVFQPLGMKDTMFQPPASLVPRIAPTEQLAKNGPPLRGVVHDPTARNMGGIAGHAGMFSTADDLARYAQMMLNGGELDGVRVISPMTIEKFTEQQIRPPNNPPSAASAGISIRPTLLRAWAASYSPSAPTATRAWLERHCGSIRPAKPTSSCSPTSFIPKSKA